MSADGTREQYDCPEWCVRDDHNEAAFDEGETVWHYGPDYPTLCTQGDGDGHFEIILADVDELAGKGYHGGLPGIFNADNTEAILAFAGDLTMAANWIELHR